MANEQNLGYAAGNNVAIRQVSQPFVAIINPDVFIDPHWLSAQIRVMQADSRVGLTGSKLFYPGGGQIMQHAGGYITFPRATTGHYGLMDEDTGQWNTLRDVDYVIGAAMLIRRSAVDEVGPFDESYFMYYDDVDLCYRLRRGGFRTVYVPEAMGTHVESATGQKGSALYFRRFHESRWRFLLKNYDLDKLLGDTVPAEKAWISLLGSMERRALYKALESILQALPSIRVSRDNDPTITPMNNSQEAGVRSSLISLREHARSEGLYSLSEISGAVRKRLGLDKFSTADDRD
jgi:GT2 family glycosyltransferase